MEQMAVGLIAHGRLGIGEDMRFELLGFAGMKFDSDDNGESSHVIFLQ